MPDPPPIIVPPPAPSLVLPAKDYVLAHMCGDLCHRETRGNGHSYVAGTGQWCYHGLDDATWARERDYHTARGHTFYVGAAKVDYLQERGEVPFDLTQDPGLFKARLERGYAAGMLPFVDLQYGAKGHGDETLAVWRRLLPELRDYLCGVLTAMELEVADGRPSAYTPEQHWELLRMLRGECGDRLAILVSPNVKSDDDPEPNTFDGRYGRPQEWWWNEGPGALVDGLGLRMPYCLLDDPKRWTRELSGAVYRLQEAFPIPATWPDDTPTDEAFRDNLRNNFADRVVIPFEYGEAPERSSEEKQLLRVFADATMRRADDSSVLRGWNGG